MVEIYLLVSGFEGVVQIWELMLPAMCCGVQAGAVAYVYTSHAMCSKYITELIFACLPICAAITIHNTAHATQLYF
jgi:hypothetical protein